jgi:hypothetical protein
VSRPDRVRIGPLTYRIMWDAAEIEAAAPNSDRGTMWAAFSNHERLIIGLNPDHAPDAQRHSLIHEILHCCLRMSGVWPDAYARTAMSARRTDVDVEEHTVSGLAGPLLGVLRDNPEILAWLAGDE